MSMPNVSKGYYPYFNVVFTMSLALFVMGFFFTVLMLAQNLIENRRKQLEVQVMLVGDKSGQEIEKIKGWIAKQEFVDVNRIRFVHKDSSAKILMQSDNQDFIKILGINPLKDALMIGILPEFDSKANFENIKSQLSKVPGVYEVELPLAQIEEINSAISKLGFFVWAMVIIFMIITISLIHNAVKLALFSQRFLIRSMKLVGATNSFISVPYIKRGAVQGLVAGLVAAGVLVCLVFYFSIYYPEIYQIFDSFRFVLILMIEISVGLVVATLATWFSVNRFLAMELDELY